MNELITGIITALALSTGALSGIDLTFLGWLIVGLFGFFVVYFCVYKSGVLILKLYKLISPKPWIRCTILFLIGFGIILLKIHSIGGIL